MGKVKKHKKHHHQDKSEAEAPLKLRIKVGGSDTVESEDGHRHKHHKKKKKKKHHRDHHKIKREHHTEVKKEEDTEEDGNTTADVEGTGTEEKAAEDMMEVEEAPSMSSGDEQGPEDADSEQEMSTVPSSPAGSSNNEPVEKVEDTGLRATRGKRINVDEDQTAVQKCLEYLHGQLQRKDMNGFFAYPVTESIAPGYSSIISHPMDMSTMKEKIENNEYSSLADYKKDFKVMCENCMTYNRPETVYYREAKRLWIICTKQMSKDKLTLLRRSVSIFTTLTDQELGVAPEESTDGNVAPIQVSSPLTRPASKQKKVKLGKFEPIPDNLTPEEILAQAQAQAKHAADTLTLRKPDSKIGFLRRQKDGTVSMTVLNPENEGVVSETERVVNLGTLTGKLTSGAGTIAGFKEDKRNKATPVSYLNYGPFSSYAPIYDSTMSSLSKEDSDLLISTYGDETAMEYATSLKSFVSNAGDFAVKMVDNLLDVLTSGEHSKSLKLLEKRSTERRENEADTGKDVKVSMESSGDKGPEIDFASLRSLSELGIDVSFLNSFENQARSDKVQAKLDQTSKLLSDLEKAQSSRLSQKPPPHLLNVQGPSEIETSLAKKVTQELTELAKQVGPVGVSSVASIRNALGISMDNVGGPSVKEGPSVEAESSVVPTEMGSSSSAPSEEKVPEPADQVQVQAPVPIVNDLQDFFEQETTVTMDASAADSVATESMP